MTDNFDLKGKAMEYAELYARYEELCETRNRYRLVQLENEKLRADLEVAIAERDKYKTCYELLNSDYATRTVVANYASLNQADRKKIDDLMAALKAIGDKPEG